MKPFLFLILALSAMQARGENLGKIKVGLTLNNGGAYHVGFTDGEVREYFKDQQKVADTLRLPTQEMAIETTSNPNILRLKFNSPVSVRQSDFNTGAPMADLKVAHVDVALTNDQIANLKMLSRVRAGEVFTTFPLAETSAEYFKELAAIGDANFLPRIQSLPEPFALEQVAVSAKLGEILSGAPQIPGFNYDYRKVVDASGKLGEEVLQSGLAVKEVVPLQNPTVQKLLETNHRLKQQAAELAAPKLFRVKVPEPLGKVKIGLTVNNQGSPEMGFPDGKIPTLFQKSQKVADAFELPVQEMAVEALPEENALRFTLEKPVTVRRADYKTGKPLPDQVITHVDAVVTPDQYNNFKQLAKVGEGDVVLTYDLAEAATKHFKDLAEKGPEHFMTDAVHRMPKVLSFRDAWLSVKAGSLTAAAPQPAYSAGFNYGEVLDAAGRVDGSGHSTSAAIQEIRPLKNPGVQRLLNSTGQLKGHFIAEGDRQFAEFMGGTLDEIFGRKPEKKEPPRMSLPKATGFETKDGKYRLLAAEGTVEVVDAKTGSQLLPPVSRPSGSKPLAVDVSAQYVAVGFEDDKVRVYTRGTGDLVRTLTAQGDQLEGLKFLGSSLVLDGEKDRYLYDARKLTYLFDQSKRGQPLDCKRLFRDLAPDTL